MQICGVGGALQISEVNGGAYTNETREGCRGNKETAGMMMGRGVLHICRYVPRSAHFEFKVVAAASRDVASLARCAASGVAIDDLKGKYAC